MSLAGAFARIRATLELALEAGGGSRVSRWSYGPWA